MGKILARNGIKFLFTAVGIFLVGSLPYFLFDIKGQVGVLKLLNGGLLNNADFLGDHFQFDWGSYFFHMKLTVEHLFHLDELKYFNTVGYYDLFPEFFHAYFFSMSLLFGALLIGLVLSIIITYLIMLISAKTRRPIRFIVFVLESLPDIFIIIVLQWLVLWFNDETGILLMNVLGVFGNAYALPIICLSILPTIYLVKYIMVAFEDQEVELYVELARGKGLRKSRILIVHILRNALITLFNQFKMIFWFGLSNLFAIAVLFHMNGGFFKFFLDHGAVNPETFTLGLLMVFVPFFLFLTAGEIVIHNLTGRKEEVL